MSDRNSDYRRVYHKRKKGGIHIKESHEGLLHKNLGVPEDKKISEAKLQKAKHSEDPDIRKQATFAENAKHWH